MWVERGERAIGRWCTELHSQECQADTSASDEGRESMMWELRGVPSSRYPSPRRSSGKREPHATPTKLCREREDISFLIGA